MASHDKILIVDFGSQVTQLIARRVREEKVYCEIAPFQKAEDALAALKPKAIILSGGPASVLDKDAPLHRPVQTVGRIASVTWLGGLHRHYVRMA